MEKIPVVIKADYVKDYILSITFDDGVKKEVDISKWFKGPMFDPLKNKVYFKNFFIDGYTVSWPNGADIAPESLYCA